MTGTPILAAGGIVLRTGDAPLIAVVLMRKRKDWVLPKGKLNRGESAREAAEREVLEETGHGVRIHEFLGTLAYETNGRPKIVHFWRMEADSAPTRSLMKDISDVDWLPLTEAVERLSRGYEKAFLAEVGPVALAMAAGTTAPSQATLTASKEASVEGTGVKEAGVESATPPSRWRRWRNWLIGCG